MEYTPEQLNYFRLCYIAFNLVPEGLRKVLKQEWDFRYKTIALGEWKDTPKNGLDFYNMESKKSRAKNARCLATIQNGNTAEWDGTCLFYAILYSDSIGTSLSPVISHDVDNLRQVRNGVAHISEAQLTDADFQNCVGKVIAAFNSLGLPISDVEEVKNQSSFPTAEVQSLMTQVDNLRAALLQAKSDLQEAQKVAKKKEEEAKEKEEEVEALKQELNSRVESFCNLAFKPSHQIIRRPKDVMRIMTKMKELEEGSKGAISTLYLSGIPGCGKSQIARQIGQEYFNKRSRESEGLTFVATMNAETLQTLVDSYFSLASQLGVAEYTLTNLATSEVDSPKETIQHLKRFISAKMKQSSNWLIIADNVVDLLLVRADLPPTGSEDWGHGQVLITTQDSSTIPCNAPHTFHVSLSQGMQIDDAVELLKEVSQIQNLEKIEKVAEVLEYQPLALAAGAVYMQTVVSNGSPTYSWTSYLETFARGEREATEEPLARQNSAYSTTMTTAIKMAVNRFAESDEVLRETFRFLSMCASDSLPIESAVDFVKFRTTRQTEELIRAKILTSTFITCLHGEDGKPGYLRVHNVVHEVLKTISVSDLQFKDRVHCISAAINTFDSIIKAEKGMLRSSRHACEKLRKITSHCKALHEVIATDVGVKDVLMKESIHPVVSWLCSAVDVCCDLSNPSDADVLSASAVDFVKYLRRTQEDDLLKAEVFTARGDALRLRCKHELALSYYEKAMVIYARIYGEEHQNVTRIYNKLGFVHRALGHLSRAKEYLKKSLFINKTISNEGNVGPAYSNLALVYSNLREHSQAKEYYEKALVIQEKIYGEEHADNAKVLNNLGNACRELGQHIQAIEHHQKALVIKRSILGEHHGGVVASYHNLGVDYRKLGQHNQAKECHEKAVSIAKKIYGEEPHSDVSKSYHSLGFDYSNLGQHNQAKECHEKALRIRKTIYGEEHPDVAVSYHNLGVSYSHLGQHNQAKECDEKALSIRKKIYGEEHPDVARSYHNLGVDYSELGQRNQAKECHEKALRIRKKIYSEEHPDVAVSYHNLAVGYSHLGQHNQAKECDEKALHIRRKIYGEEHPDVAASYRRLGVDYRNLRQHNQVKECHEKELSIRKKIYCEEHPEVAASYDNLGVDYYKLGQHIQAKECHEKALSIRRKIYGEEHPDVATSYQCLASVYNKLKQHNQAKECNEKTLSIRKKIYGEEHPHVADSYNNMGVDYMELGNYKEAKECHEKALMIREKIYGEGHPKVEASCHNLTLLNKKCQELQNGTSNGKYQSRFNSERKL